MGMQSQVVVDNIPWFEDEDKAIAEVKAYLSMVKDFKQSENLVTFWNKVPSGFPRLAEIAFISLSVPVDRVAAEHSFSMYSAVLRDNRRSTEECNLTMYYLLYQNDL